MKTPQLTKKGKEATVSVPACCADSGCDSHSMYLVSITVHAWELVPNAAKLHILLVFNFLPLVAHCSEVSIQGEGGPTHMNTYVHSHIHKCVCTHTHIHKFASMQYNTKQKTKQNTTLHYTTLHYNTNMDYNCGLSAPPLALV